MDIHVGMYVWRVTQEPQFLCGPICFVLFVLLINEIRGAACWDGPAAPLRWTGPLSHGLNVFFPDTSSLYFSLSCVFSPPQLPLSVIHLPPSIFFDIISFIYFFVFQFVTLVDAQRQAR